MSDSRKSLLLLAAPVSLALLAFLVLLALPFQSAQAVQGASSRPVEQTDPMTGTMPMMDDMSAMTGTMPMMGDMMSMTADMMDMMSMMSDMPMTGTMPMMGSASHRALSLSLMGSMLEAMGFMHELSAPCLSQGTMSMMGSMSDMTGTMPMMGDMGNMDNMTSTMPMMGDMDAMTGTMPMTSAMSDGAMLRMMGQMLKTMGSMQAMMDAIVPQLTRGAPVLSRTIAFQGGEGDIAKPLKDVQDQFADVTIGSYPFESPQGFATNLVLRTRDAARLAAATEAVKAAANALVQAGKARGWSED